MDLRTVRKADTNRPVLVYDVKRKSKGHLHPHEIELLLGHQKNVTRHPTVTSTDRNRCLGNGWDLNVVDELLKDLEFGSVKRQHLITGDHSGRPTWLEVWEGIECKISNSFMMR